MMRHFILLALAALAGCSDRSGRQAADPRIADASRPLVLVTRPTEPPFAYRDASGAIVGTDIDLARKIAAKMGRTLVVESVDFSEPYHTAGTCFMYKSGAPKPRMSQVSSLRIGVETDTVDEFYLCRHGCDPKRFANLAEAVDALEKDEIDAVFFDAPPLKVKADSSGGRYVVTPLETRDGYGVAVDKRRPDVLAAANAVIAEGGVK